MQLSTHRGSTFHSPGLHFPTPGPRVQLSTHPLAPRTESSELLEAILVEIDTKRIASGNPWAPKMAPKIEKLWKQCHQKIDGGKVSKNDVKLIGK